MKRNPKIRKPRGADWAPKITYLADRQMWLVDCGYKFGKDSRLRKSFVAEDDAKLWAATKQKEHRQLLRDRKGEDQTNAPFRFSSITEMQKTDIASLLTRTDGDTKRLVKALDYFERNHTKGGITQTLQDVFNDYVTAKQNSGRRLRTLRDIRSRVGKFVTDFGKQKINEISATDVEGWLNARELKPVTRNCYRVRIHGVFDYALKKRFIEHNPVSAIDASHVDQTTPQIHTVAQVQAILKQAQAHLHPEKILPFLCIGYFAGLRHY